MRLVLIRHGDAHAGLSGVIAGPRGCRGLTDRGRAQAAALRDHLAATGFRADALLASVLPRAIETASIIAPGLGIDDVGRDCDLCEVHTGEADGLDWAVWERQYGPLDMATEPERLFAPGGDSWTSFHERVRTTLERLATEHPDETVVAVCHAGVIAASLTVMFGEGAGSTVRLRPDNTGLTGWAHDPATATWTLEYYNDTTHLAGTA